MSLAFGDGVRDLPPGGHFVENRASRTSIGFLTSCCFSETLGRCVGLGLIKGGRARHGEEIILYQRGHLTVAKLVAPQFYDPANFRLRKPQRENAS